LIVQRDKNGIVDEFLAVRVTEFRQVSGGEFEPAGERIAADDRGAQRVRLHR
jgi:hypothetical protein